MGNIMIKFLYFYIKYQTYNTNCINREVGVMNVRDFQYIMDLMEQNNLSDVLEHGERTAMLCYATAKEFDLDPEYLEIAYTSGLLHEIGKVNLHDKLILREHEIDVENIYPYFSANLIKCFKGFENVAGVVIQNSENYDGSGYPYGLAGEEIGFIARILRISDYYDTHRMNDMTHDETTKKIRENTDIIFPKKIITPFIKAVIKNKLHGDDIYAFQ